MNRLTKLQQLIKELCPNGVEYKKVKHIFKRLKGTPITAGKMKEIENPLGEIKIFAGGKTIINADEKNIPNASIIRVPAVLVQSRGVIDVIYYDKPFTFKNEMWAYTIENKVTVKFLYYILKNNIQTFRNAASGMGALPQISLPITEEFEIPVPPLPVQEEIVRILDELTEKTDELISELNAELDERKKQYEYFQNQLFANSVDMQYVDVPLGDVIVSLKTGLNPRKNFKLNTPDSCCPYITGKDIFNNKVNVTARTDEITMDSVALINKRACIETDDLLFASTGTGTVGRMAIVEDYRGDWSISESIYAIKVNKNIALPQFLMYLLYTENVISQYKPKITKASVPHLKVADLLKVKISIPSIQEQKRIIKTAETLTATQDLLISNLMHEIENRKKQYEYYRDKLLTF